MLIDIHSLLVVSDVLLLALFLVLVALILVHDLSILLLNIVILVVLIDNRVALGVILYFRDRDAVHLFAVDYGFQGFNRLVHFILVFHNVLFGCHSVF